MLVCRLRHSADYRQPADVGLDRELPRLAEGPVEIAVIVKTGNSSFWQNVQTGAMDAQKELKAQTPKLSVTFLGAQSESNINEEINIVESAIDRGVKAIVLAPSDVTALHPAVKKAKDAGIPVIIIDSQARW